MGGKIATACAWSAWSSEAVQEICKGMARARLCIVLMFLGSFCFLHSAR